MGRLIHFFFLNLVAIPYCFAQITITGKVSEKNSEEALPYASITVANKTASSSILAFSHTDVRGEYSVSIQEPGQYIITSRLLGYTTQTKNISVSNKINPQIDFILKREIQELNEVVLYENKSIVFKKDTIEYLAKNYKTGYGQTVSELLENVPGINVDENGKIRVNNKEIDRIMIEGDDFLGKGYSILSQSMPSQNINTIQVIDRYNQNPLLGDLIDSNKVALNLTLEDEAKTRWFGSLDAGHDVFLKPYHSTKLVGFKFSKKTKHFGLVTTNSIGENSTITAFDELLTSNLSEAGNTIRHLNSQKNFGEIVRGDISVPYLKREQWYFNNEKFLSWNSILNPSKFVKIRASLIFNFDNNPLEQFSLTELNTGQSVFNILNQQSVKNKSSDFLSHLLVNVKTSPKSLLELHSIISKQEDKKAIANVLNNTSYSGDLNTSILSFKQYLNFTQKISSKQALLVKSQFEKTRIPQGFNIDAFFLNQIIDSTFSQSYQNAEIITSHFSTVVDWLTNIKDRKKIAITSSFEQTNHEFSVNNNFNSNLRDRFTKSRFDLSSLLINEKDNVKHTFSLGLSYLNNELSNIKNQKGHWYLNPLVEFNYQRNKLNITGKYYRSLEAANLSQVFPVLVFENYNSLNLNRIDPINFPSHSLTINSVYGTPGVTNFGFISLSYNYLTKYVSTNRTFSADAMVSNNVVLEDGHNTTVLGEYNFFIKPLRNNLKVSGSYLSAKQQNQVDNINRDIKAEIYSVGLSFKSANQAKLAYHMGSDFIINKTQSVAKFSIINTKSFLDITLKINDRHKFSIIHDNYLFENGSGINNLIVGQISYSLKLKIQDSFLTLKSQNIYNTQVIRPQSITDVSNSFHSYNLLPRFFLLSSTLKF